MSAYNKATRKLVIDAGDTAGVKALASYAQGKDAYESVSESGILREIYREEKLAEYLADPAQAAKDKKAALEAIRDSLFAEYESTFDGFLAVGVPASEARARAQVTTEIIGKTKMAQLDATLPRDIFQVATLADASAKTQKISAAKSMLKAIQ